MTFESHDGKTLRRYTKPNCIEVSTTEVLLHLLGRAEQDERLANHLKESIHQVDGDFTMD